MKLFAPVLHGTDSGPTCVCGGTIYSYIVSDYDVSGAGVDIQCMGCHVRDFIHTESALQTVIEIRELHVRHARASNYALNIALLRAYQLGRESVGDRDADCPYDDDSALADEWNLGREHAEQELGDEYADYCDPSMRDCYE